jgi:phosphohistidine phosphatase
MKKLIFVRHGRAEEPAQEISDLERSLTLKGKNISKLMARKLKELESTPGIIITSPAFRALETAIIFAREFSIDPENIIMDNNFYYKMNFKYLTELLSLKSDNIESVTLFGHNPSFSEISDILCKQGCDYMPKSGVIGISFNIKSWTELKQHQGKIEYFLKPENLL